jgi:PAS domain S-box-containing protein
MMFHGSIKIMDTHKKLTKQIAADIGQLPEPVRECDQNILRLQQKLPPGVGSRQNSEVPAVKTCEWRYRELFEQSQDAIVLHENGKIIDANNRMCEMLGYRKSVLCRMNLGAFVSKVHRGRQLQRLNRKEKTVRFETQWIKADGSLIDVEITSIILDTKKRIMQAVVRDVTAQKAADEKFHAYEQFYRTLMENTDLSFNLIDTNFNILQISRATGKRQKLNQHEIIGKKCFAIFEGRENICPHCPGIKAIQSGKRQERESRVETAGGQFHYVKINTFPVFGRDGRVNAFIEMVQDITESKENEKKLRIAMETAEVANQAKSNFLANMSHEIRTPLNGVMGVLNLLLETSPDCEQLDLIETGKRSADGLLTVINDVLDFSKIEAGELDLEIINFNLRNTLAEVVELPAMQANEKGLEFAYEIETDVPSLLRGDPGRLRQILINLTNNAVKFTQHGEVFLRITLENETESEVCLRFEVRDTGIGIPADKLDVVFESFKQSDSSTTRNYGGTGLGLSISKKLAALMRGDIGVKSESGLGSVFWFSAVFEKQADMEEKILVPPSDFSQKRFLLVDDNPTNLSILKRYVTAWGGKCDVAESGDIALRLLNAVAKVDAPFDVAILDMRMPGMDGAELGRRIKSDPKLAKTNLVMLTSLGLRGDAAHMEKIGFAAYLTKPIRRSQFFDCLVNILSAKQQKPDRIRPQLITKHSLSENRKRKSRVLLVEDNFINQKLTLRMLEKFGFRADVAANGREAVKMLSKFKYQIVLMDIQMPEMDGYEATKFIRNPESNVIDHGIHIIAMTANAMKGDRDLCLKAGMDDYIAKPIDPHNLSAILDKYTGP